MPARSLSNAIAGASYVREHGAHVGRPRILVAAPQPFYEDRGTPIALRQVLEALSQLGYAADVVTYPVGESVAILGVRYFRLSNPLGIRRVPIGFSLRKLFFDAQMIRALDARLRAERYHCIHAVEEAAFPAVVLGHRYGVPVIYDMQSSLPEQLAARVFFRTAPVRRRLLLCEQWLLRHADLVVCSTGLEDHVRRAAPQVRLWDWRFTGITPSVQPHDVLRLRQSLGIAPATQVVLYSGNFEWYQGLPELLAAIPLVRAEVPDVAFVLVGARGAERAELLRRIGSDVPPDALRLVERQPRELLACFLAMADVLVSPRITGANLPLKVFDYLAVGRPIIATDIPTHRALLDEERALLVAPDARSLARGIAAVLHDPARGRRLGDAARAYAEQHLGWTSFVRVVDEIYGAVGSRV